MNRRYARSPAPAGGAPSPGGRGRESRTWRYELAAIPHPSPPWERRKTPLPDAIGAGSERRHTEKPQSYKPTLRYLLRFPAAFDVDLEAFNFLVEGGEGDLEAFGGFGLAPFRARQHVEDNAPFARFHDFEE